MISKDELVNGDQHDGQVHNESPPNPIHLIEEMKVLMGDRLGAILTKWVEENHNKSIKIIELTAQVNQLTQTNDERGGQIKALEEKIKQSSSLDDEGQASLLNRKVQQASPVGKLGGTRYHAFG